MIRLDVDDDELAACVACGLCLPHCPTYRVTGLESASPRGRIAAMRAVHWDGAPLDESFREFMDLCVQCRGCEAACPSSVPFGRLMEGARHTLAAEQKYQPWWRRAGYALLGRHRLLLAASTGLAVGQRLGLVPSRLGLPKVPLRRGRPVASSGGDVWLFTGCVMDAWMRDVHRRTKAVIEATGATVAVAERGGDCCGALAAHGGLLEQARRLAARVMVSMPGDAPILVNSAGCGAQLKEYGHLVGTPDAAAFSARVLDVHEWLAGRLTSLPPATGPRPRVAVQDACHLRHVQRVHLHVRAVLAPYAELVELDDDGLCCGAGGAYSAVHPDMAGAIRERKVAAIARTGASAVVSANPGCILHLRAAGLDVRHPVDVIADAIEGSGPGTRATPA